MNNAPAVEIYKVLARHAGFASGMLHDIWLPFLWHRSSPGLCIAAKIWWAREVLKKMSPLLDDARQGRHALPGDGCHKDSISTALSCPITILSGQGNTVSLETNDRIQTKRVIAVSLLPTALLQWLRPPNWVAVTGLKQDPTRSGPHMIPLYSFRC